MTTLNLLEEVKAYFNNEFISEASRNLKESDTGITEALSAILPSTIGLISEQTKKPGGAEKIATLATRQHGTGVLSALTSFIKHQTTASSAKLSSTVFADDVDKSMISKVAAFSKIKESSAATLYDIALPTILALLGRHLNDNKLDNTFLPGYFTSADTVKHATMPLGFGTVAAGAAVHSTSSVTHGVKESAPVIEQHDNVRPAHAQDPTHLDDKPLHAAVIEGPINPINGFSWVLPLLTIAALIAVLWYCTLGPGNDYTKPELKENDTATPFMRERIQPGVEVNTLATEGGNSEQPSELGTLDGKTGDYMYNEGDITTIALPNGKELKAGKNSTEAKLVSFLNDQNIAVDEKNGNWYEFTNVHFKLNSAELEKVSETQLKNIVAITKAFPNAKFKFGGYTDNTGDAAINKPLSQKRAEAVAMLVESYGGSANSFVAPEGYGAEHPIADNGTAVGRAMNRRVAVNVKVK